MYSIPPHCMAELYSTDNLPMAANANTQTINAAPCGCSACAPDNYRNLPHAGKPDVPSAPFRSAEYKKEGFCVGLPDVCAYEALGLATAVAKSIISRGAYTAAKRHALADWKVWNAEHQNDSHERMTGPRLAYLFALLNEIFFWGSIRNTTVVLRARELLGSSEYNLAYTDWPALRDDTDASRFSGALSDYPIATIHLDPFACERDRRRRNLTGRLMETHRIVGVLLHEMCHVYLGQYACKGIHAGCKTCGFAHACASAACGHLYVANVNAGHGRAWHTLAKAIEENCERVLGIRTRVRGLADLRNELRRVEGWRPSRCDVQRLFPGFDEDRLLGWVDCVKGAHEGGDEGEVNDAVAWLDEDEEKGYWDGGRGEGGKQEGSEGPVSSRLRKRLLG
jgi:hypothetical protein